MKKENEDKNKLWRILDICSQINNIDKKSLSFVEKIFLPFKIYKWKYMLDKEIQSLKHDEWDYDYIKHLDLTLQHFYDDKMEAISGKYFTISELNKDETLGKTFKEMLFVDSEKDTVITIKYIYLNIKFLVFNTRTGSKYELNSVSTLTKRQKKISEVCKDILVKGITEYVNTILIPFKK